jgi:hypothetical protein
MDQISFLRENAGMARVIPRHSGFFTRGSSQEFVGEEGAIKLD